MELVIDANLLLDRPEACDQARTMGYTPTVLNSTLDELVHVSRRRSDAGVKARVALVFIEKQKIPVRAAKGKGDGAVLAYAIAHQCSVATNDRELIKALHKMHITVLRLRQGRLLVEA